MGIRRSRAFTAIIALLSLTSGLLVSGATAASAAPAATPELPWIGTGQVSSGAGTDMCLDNSGGSNAAGNPIDLYQCNDTWDGQVWTLEYDGTLRIQNRCLDVQGGSSTDGTPVLLNKCNGSGSPGEQWEPQTDGSLLNVNSGKCLGINGAVANGSPLFIWTCDGNDTQVWHVPTADTKAASAAARLQLMWNSNEDLFDSTTTGNCTSVTAPAGNCWWWSANELNAMIDFIWQEQAVSGPTFPGWYAYESDISQTFNQYADGCEPSPSNGCTGLFTHDGYFDDAGWWGLTWLNAYNLIGNTDYLYMAENIFSWITANGWDSTCDGGVWQYDQAGAQKDAIANELYFELAAPAEPHHAHQHLPRLRQSGMELVREPPDRAGPGGRFGDGRDRGSAERSQCSPPGRRPPQRQNGRGHYGNVMRSGQRHPEVDLQPGRDPGRAA